jgi:hypothetical protein
LTYACGAKFHSGVSQLWLADCVYDVFDFSPTARNFSMPDHVSKRGPSDRTRVEVNEKWEVDFWCKRFRCTETELKDAVKLIGPMATAVKAQLLRNRQTRVHLDSR